MPVTVGDSSTNRCRQAGYCTRAALHAWLASPRLSSLEHIQSGDTATDNVQAPSPGCAAAACLAGRVGRIRFRCPRATVPGVVVQTGQTGQPASVRTGGVDGRWQWEMDTGVDGRRARAWAWTGVGRRGPARLGRGLGRAASAADASGQTGRQADRARSDGGLATPAARSCCSSRACGRAKTAIRAPGLPQPSDGRADQPGLRSR